MTTEIQQVSSFRKSLTTLGPIGFHLFEDGEIVDQVHLSIGYSSRQIETLLTDRPFIVGATFADKIDFHSPQSGSLAFAHAVELLSSIEVPKRGEMIRVLLLEMSRISNHIHFLGTVAKELHMLSVYHFCLREREKFNDLFELYCGSRMGFGCIQIGGVTNDVSEGLIDKIETTLAEIKLFLVELDAMMIGSPIIRGRLRSLATLGEGEVKKNKLSGPNARAANVDADLRVDSPFSGYKFFDMPKIYNRNASGNALSRILGRVAEIEQSMEIINLVTRELPEGNFKIDLGIDFTPPKGDVFAEIESPRGNFGVYVLSNGSKTPQIVRFCTPSTNTLRVAPWLIRKEMVEDVGLILASLDISVSEVDK